MISQKNAIYNLPRYIFDKALRLEQIVLFLKKHGVRKEEFKPPVGLSNISELWVPVVKKPELKVRIIQFSIILTDCIISIALSYAWSNLISQKSELLLMVPVRDSYTNNSIINRLRIWHYYCLLNYLVASFEEFNPTTHENLCNLWIQSIRISIIDSTKDKT